METKRLITLMLVSFVVIFGWQLLIYHFYPNAKKQGTATTTTAPATTAPAAAPESYATTQATPASAPTAPTVAATQPAGQPQLVESQVRVVAPATQPHMATLGTGTGFPMIVKVNSAGAGLDSVTLKEFHAPGGKGDYVFQEPYPGADDQQIRAMATYEATVNGTPVSLANVQWTHEREEGASVTYVVDLGLARIHKTFEVVQSTPKGKHHERYDLNVSYTIENTSKAPVKVKLAFNGPTTPPHENEQGRDVQVLGGYDNGYGSAKIAHHFIEEFDEKKPTLDLTRGDDGKSPLLWAGTSSVYFNARSRPVPLDPNSADPQYTDNISATALNPKALPMERHVLMTFQTGEQSIAPGSSLTLPATLYLGPRWREVLNQPHYAQFPLDFDETLVLTSGPCAYCTFGWLVTALVKLLNAFHWIFRDWGLAIIALVIVVRTLLHPITKRSQVAMMRMGKMGPEIERLKKKHGDDKDELNRQMMALYKEQGVGAYLGCLPMFLQMPIWIALWSALNSTFELRQADFLWSALWFHDLARPDRLFVFSHPIHIPLVGWTLTSINLLPVLLAVVFYLQQEFTPKPPATTPEQETQQKMMKWMSLLFPIFLYNQPSGLNLYILTSTSIGIIESKRIRDHIKQKEEEEKAGKIFVDAPKGMKKKRGDDDDGGPGTMARKTKGPQAPKTGFGGWIEQLKNRAEQLQRDADRQRGK